MQNLLTKPGAPVLAMLLVVAVSLAFRLAFLATPSALIFDEHYYVNAAKRMLNLPVQGDIYAEAPPQMDPNGSHPGLGKLAIAAGIKLLGNNAFAWRIPSVIFGIVVLFAIHWLARSAGAGRWASVGATGLAAVDTLLLVHSRIATLDIFALPFMILGVCLYVRGRPLLSGLAIGVGASAKLVALSALLVLALFELFGWLLEVRSKPFELKEKAKKAGSLALVAGVAAATLLTFTHFYDRAFYSSSSNPAAHIVTMLRNVSGGGRDPSVIALSVEEADTSTAPIGDPVLFRVGRQNLRRASTVRPVEWLLNREPINYFSRTKRAEVRSWTLLGQRTAKVISFTAIVNPVIIFMAIPALLFCSWSAWRRRDAARFLPVAWFGGTFGPFLIADLTGLGRPGFLYYMLIVLPGVYVAIAILLSGRKVAPVWGPALALSAIACFWIYYPFRTWAGV